MCALSELGTLAGDSSIASMQVLRYACRSLATMAAAHPAIARLVYAGLWQHGVIDAASYDPGPAVMPSKRAKTSGGSAPQQPSVDDNFDVVDVAYATSLKSSRGWHMCTQLVRKVAASVGSASDQALSLRVYSRAPYESGHELLAAPEATTASTCTRRVAVAQSRAEPDPGEMCAIVPRSQRDDASMGELVVLLAWHEILSSVAYDGTALVSVIAESTHLRSACTEHLHAVATSADMKAACPLLSAWMRCLLYTSPSPRDS